MLNILKSRYHELMGISWSSKTNLETNRPPNTKYPGFSIRPFRIPLCGAGNKNDLFKTNWNEPRIGIGQNWTELENHKWPGHVWSLLGIVHRLTFPGRSATKMVKKTTFTVQIKQGLPRLGDDMSHFTGCKQCHFPSVTPSKTRCWHIVLKIKHPNIKWTIWLCIYRFQLG